MADDDNIPLSKLPAAKKLDDDTPLVALVDSSRKSAPAAKKAASKAGPAKAPGQAAAKAPGQPGAKGRPKKLSAPGGAATAGAKRKTSSSSSGSSSSSSSSDGSQEEAKTKQKRQKLLRKKQPVEENADDTTGGAVKKRDRSAKEEIVAQLLSRWWYSAEYIDKDWPPDDEAYYEDELRKNCLRKVTIQEWEWVPDVDEEGRRKVYELSQFRGVFRNSTGELVDLRPKDTCPCYNNFMKKDMATLCRMLISAYENQMKDLANSKYAEGKVENDIKVALTKTRKSLHEAEQMK